MLPNLFPSTSSSTATGMSWPPGMEPAANARCAPCSLAPASRPASSQQTGSSAPPRHQANTLWRDLPDHAAIPILAILSAGRRGAVQIALAVHHNIAPGITAVAGASEIVQVGIGPAAGGRRQLENFTIIVSAIPGSGAVEIALCIHHQAGDADGSIIDNAWE